MSGRSEIERLLRTDPRDAGCDTTMALMHVYAELAVVDPSRTARRYRDVAVHLEACEPCAEDLEGLLRAIADTGGSTEPA